MKVSAVDTGLSSARIDAVLDGLAAARRDAAAAQAREVALLAEAYEVARGQADADGSPSRSEVSDVPVRSMAAQIAAVWRVSDRTVQRQLSDAVVVTARFAATLGALADGEVSSAHVRVIVEAGLPIEDDQARAVYEAAVLDVARRETPGRLRTAARLLAGRLHPVPLAERHMTAASVRDVWVRDLDEGMAELIATLPAVIAHGIRDRLNQYARATVDARRADSGADPGAGGDLVDDPAPVDTRGVGEVRADVLADLLLTGHASAEASHASIAEGDALIAQVQLTVPVMTVLGHDTTPAELAGHGPVDTATALRLAGGASGWDRVLTHPVTGTVLGVDRYRPSDQLRRALRVRDEHCRFPGCRIPTRRCDIDHTTARDHDGPTQLDNLAHLCRRHHTLKHHSAWRVRQTPDGVLHWTSPTGRTYPDQPARTLTFTEPQTGTPPGENGAAPPRSAPPHRPHPGLGAQNAPPF